MSWIWVLKLIPAVEFLGLILILLALYFWGFKPLLVAALMFGIITFIPLATLFFVGVLFENSDADYFVIFVTVLAFLVSLVISLIVGFFLARGMDVSFGKACLLAYVPFCIMLSIFLQVYYGITTQEEKNNIFMRLKSDSTETAAISARIKELQSNEAGSHKRAEANDPQLVVWAMSHQNWDAFDALIQAGADASMALPDIVRMANTDRLQQALRAGANVNAQNGYGNTALHMACSYGKTEAVPILIEAGADVNITNLDGESALWLAVGQGNVAAVEQLLRAGARTDVSNRQGKTLFAYAQEKGNAAVLQSLQKAGSNSL